MQNTLYPAARNRSATITFWTELGVEIPSWYDESATNRRVVGQMGFLEHYPDLEAGVIRLSQLYDGAT